MAKNYSLGIDVGSTTVKTVITDTAKNIIYSRYQRHFSKVKETVTELCYIPEYIIETDDFVYVLGYISPHLFVILCD